MTPSPITDEAVEAAVSAFISSVREQDDEWTDEVDEEILLVGPSGDYIAPLFPMRVALEAALSAIEPTPDAVPETAEAIITPAIDDQLRHATPEAAEELERYSHNEGDWNNLGEMVSEPSGDWVRHSDALAIIEKLRAENERLHGSFLAESEAVTFYRSASITNRKHAEAAEARIHELEQMVNDEEANHQDTALRLRNAEARLAEAVEKLGYVQDEARIANDVIRLNRDGRGQGRVKVATAMHRIEQASRTFLQSLGKEAPHDKA